MKQRPIKKILALRNDRFGELLLNIPALRALKEKYPDASLILAVSPDNRELAGCIEYADRVAVWDDHFRRGLRKQGFDICVVLNPTKEAHWETFFAGIPIRVGYNRKWGFLLTRKMADNKALGLKHEVEYNLELAGLAGGATSDKSIRLGRLPGQNNPAYTGAIAIHPYTSDPLKEWGPGRFRELAARVSDELGLRVLIVGKEDGSGGRGFERAGNNIVDLVNMTSLVELAQVLKQCELLVTCDSGPMHLAAAVGTPVVALFRNDLPGKTARRWGPWGEGHIIIEKGKLTDISVEEVMQQLKDLLVK